MNKIKLFVENFIVYGLGGIIGKIVPLIMLPIITRLMPDVAYFGISDLHGTLVSFCSSFAVMGMYDAMYRMFFEKKDVEYQKDICSTAFLFTIASSVVIFLLMIFLKKIFAKVFFGDPKYEFLVCIGAIAVLAGATNSIISAPTRMQNKRKIFLLTNIISSVLSYAVSIPLLLTGYYVIAIPLASLISCVLLELVFVILNHKWFEVKRFNRKYLKQLLYIAIPLTPNFLIYWVFNSSDKLMITNLLDVGATGIYSVGSKLGHASQLIYTAFAGGWQYFAFSTMHEKNQVESNSRVFEYLGVISYGASTLVFALAQSIYQWMFAGDYVRGFIISPYLFLAPLLLMMFQVASNQFLVVKKTWPNLFILSTGAGINICLNLVLIPKIGIEGAAIATLLGYIVADVIVIIVLYQMNLIILRWKFIFATVVMGIYIVFWRLQIYDSIALSLLCAISCCTIFLLLYKKDIMHLLRTLMAIKVND